MKPVKISQPGQRLAQPSIARLSDGRILAILRDRDAKKAYRSVSDDDGHSWSDPVPLKVPNSNKAVTVRALQSIAWLYGRRRRPQNFAGSMTLRCTIFPHALMLTNPFTCSIAAALAA